MRLWSIHPRYLDAKGLIALWRETLLAQKVLAGKTKGYTKHPQLNRFKKTRDPLAFIGSYLQQIVNEADRRGYNFDANKIIKQRRRKAPAIPVTKGQVQYETEHLLRKLKSRDPSRFEQLKNRKTLSLHPLFYSISGPIEDWEVIT